MPTSHFIGRGTAMVAVHFLRSLQGHTRHLLLIASVDRVDQAEDLAVDPEVVAVE